MRRIIFTLFICSLTISALAQVGPTVHSVGYSQSQKKVTVGKRQLLFGVSGGNVVNGINTTIAPLTAIRNEVIGMGGFPQPVSYFPQIFQEDFFVSKGYFPNAVQLRWDVLEGSSINQFRIFRKQANQPGDSVLIAVTGPDVFFHEDESIDFGVVYEYTVFAKGIADDLRIPLVNFVQQDGFAFPAGSVSGQVRFQGGTAVEGVTVVATTEGNLSGQSMRLDGTSFLRVDHGLNDEELELNQGFSVQLWNKFEGTQTGVLFSKGDDYSLTYDGSSLSFKVADAILDMAFVNPVDSFFHVSAVYSPGQELRLEARVSENRISQKTIAAGQQPVGNFAPVLFGRNVAGDFYKGYIDEARIWQRALPTEEIATNFLRYIAGTEQGLSAYWRFDMGIGREFYDFAREGSIFKENHGTLFRASFADLVPLQSQLSFRGLTNQQGNYTITGFPYETTGSLYQFTALREFHTFDPPQQTRFVGPSESIHNEIDFTDISSFEVSGKITYKGGPFPVEGATILIDGSPAFNAEGVTVLTDGLGEFTVDVPIGFHSIRANLQSHGFENEGRFPVPTDVDNAPLFNFQSPIAGIEFIDTTLVKLTGRVVGGPIEAGKLLGFSLSNNNIGNATIQLTTQRELDITSNAVTQNLIESNAGEDINTTVTLSTNTVTIEPDQETGEFIAFLPPEQYVISSARAGDNIFGNSFLTTVDLRGEFFIEDEIFADTVGAEVNGTAVPGFTPFNEEDFDGTSLFTRNDTTFTVALDTFSYNQRHDFILRVAPSITVQNLEGNEIFGEREFLFEDENLGVSQTISLVDEATGEYTYSHPIFKQRRNYQMQIEVFEEYVNVDNGNAEDRVPVIDGRIEVENNLALQQQDTLTLDASGMAFYEFSAGQPNLNFDNDIPENSFTNTINVTAFTGNDGSIQTVYRPGDPLRGIVFGGRGSGNNFVTTGPSQITNILRDPPGSASYSFFEENVTTSTENTWSVADVNNQSQNATVHLGVQTTTFTGAGGGVAGAITGTINEGGSKGDISAGVETQQTYTDDSTVVVTTTYSNSFLTSAGAQFVGRDADVFIGYSTNLIYGNTIDLQPVPASGCAEGDCGAAESSEGFKLGFKSALRMDPQINTFFILTQQTIEDVTIPGLRNIRDNFLIYSTLPDTINALNEPVYVSLVPPDDPRYGSDNGDASAWGADATRAIGVGPSYVIRVPQSFMDEGKFVSDTVFFYNQEVQEFIDILAANEQVKLQSKLQENISFDGGTTLERSTTISNATMISRTKEFLVSPSVGGETGGEQVIFGSRTGLTVNTTASFGDVNGDGTTTTNEKETTYGFVLEDGDLGDTYSVDVFEANDGFGPVFSTRGGQTACPFEPEFKTKYFEPGRLLSAATARREGPVVTADESVLANIPDNRPAQFTLNLSSDSETNEAFNYTLMIDPTTNPNGAAIAVNGSDIGDGFSFLVNSGEVLKQTISIEQGRPDVFEYENLRFLLVSQCQFDPTDPQLDIADTVSLSAFFVPGCSDVNISSPGENWVVNTNTPQQDTLLVTIDEYDLNLSDFTRMQFQYRGVGSSNFIANMTFYNSQNVTQEEFDVASEPKMLISDPSIIYPFDMSSLPDQEYDIRVVAFCDAGPGVVYETPSQVLRGIKDTQRPQLFGAPQPADGILSANDEILIRFNEPVVGGLLTPSNFSIMGVLNNAPVNNDVSVSLDGVNDYIRIEDGLGLGSSSFTIEFKLRRNTIDKEVVVFSKGFIASDALEIGFTTANMLFVKLGDQILETSIVIDDTSNFNHYTISYDAQLRQLFAYMNDRFLLEQVPITGEYSGVGPISLGRSNITSDRLVDGNVLDLRIWTRFRTLTDVFAGIETQLTGAEIGLAGYWPFDEGFGTNATDRARFSNATLFADWLVLPQGSSYEFDGVDDFIEINTASTVTVDSESDFTIEFWFNAGPGQANAVMFSSGRGTSVTEEEGRFEDPSRSLSIGLDAQGELYIASNGEITLLDVDEEELFDNNWHHFAFSLSRIGSARLYIDGGQVESFSPDSFGAMFRATMTLGARGFNTSLTTTAQDMFFDGLMDEFRIWNTSRTGEQVVLDRNAKLRGDEFGLQAYYPFDAFENNSGVQVLASSLDDQFTNSNGPNGGTAQAGGGAFSVSTPNITLQRPVQDVPFSFVVNNDEIIITPSSSVASIIERSILEISLANVEDENGNRLSSPVTFTAFVDRNLVKWGRDNILLEKKPNDVLSFEVAIVNLGGSEERYDISNLPLWLDVTPSSGSIEPQSSESLIFTVNPGLNNGYYNEDIFLTTDFGFNEKLNINLRVLEPAPDWNINPADFEFSMSIVASLEVSDVLSRDENDLLAAYVGNELRGAAQLKYVPEFDQFMVFMDIYSNDANENVPIEFRAFDANEGIEYRNLAPINPVFQSNVTIGRPSNPQILSTGILRAEEVVFAQGFSWRSFNLNAATLDNTNTLLSGVAAVTNDRVTGLGVIDVYTEGLGWLGNLTGSGGYDPDTYYLFSLENGGAIDLVGTAVNPDTDINIAPGFNRIGFIPDFFLSIDEAFSGVNPESGDIVRGQFAFAVFEEGLGWIGSLDNLEPGQGYLYFSNASEIKVLRYPRNTFLSNEVAPDEEEVFWEHPNPWQTAVHQFPLNMSLIAELDTEKPEQFAIAAFDEENLVGTITPKKVNGKYVYYLSIYGEVDSKKVSFKAFDMASGKYYRILNDLNYVVNTLEGTLETPFILSLDEEELLGDKTSKAFPNPFVDQIEIKLGRPSTEVSYQISDINGLVIFSRSLVSEKKIRSIFWSGTDSQERDLPQGVYLVKLLVDGHIEYVKVLKSK